MEIFGNPITGYNTLHYQKIFEQLSIINENYAKGNLHELDKNGHYNSTCNSSKCLNYKNRNKGNVNCCSQISQEGLEIRIKNQEVKLKSKPKNYKIKKC